MGRKCLLGGMAFGEDPSLLTTLVSEEECSCRGDSKDKICEAKACLSWSEESLESRVFGVEGAKEVVAEDKIGELVNGKDHAEARGMLGEIHLCSEWDGEPLKYFGERSDMI